MCARRLLIPAFLLLCLAVATAARAGEAKVYPLNGRLYAEIGGYVSAPSGPMTGQFDQITGGASFQFGIGLRGIPATLGIGAHQTELSSTTWTTGESGYFSYGGNSGYGDLSLHRSLDVRGADLVFRLEPERWWIRPFLEIRGGFLQIHCTWSLSATVNGELLGQEKTGNITWSWGYGGGLRLEPFRVLHSAEGDIAFFVSFGVRQVHAGPLRYLEPRGSNIGGVYTYTFSIDEPSYRAIEPFLLLGFESRSP
jgi:hypothetical protein